MGNGGTKENQNVYFRARKQAALYNEKLSSREGAAEMLGISPSTLADYELGITKFVPVDKVVLMADLYNCPELRTGYCKYESLIQHFNSVCFRSSCELVCEIYHEVVFFLCHRVIYRLRIFPGTNEYYFLHSLAPSLACKSSPEQIWSLILSYHIALAFIFLFEIATFAPSMPSFLMRSL